MLVEHREPLSLPTPVAIAAVDAEPSRWLRGVDAFHRSLPSPATLVVDAVVLIAAVQASGGSRPAALAGSAAFLVAGGLSGLYGDRGVLESQGVAWYVRALPIPLLAAAAALSAAGHGAPQKLIVPLVVAGVVLALLRSAAWTVVAGSRRRGAGLVPALLVASSQRASEVVRRVEAYPESGVRIAATYAPSNTNGERSRAHRLLRRGAIRYVLVAATPHDDPVIDDCLRWGAGSGVELAFVLPVGHSVRGSSRIGDLAVALGQRRPRQRGWAKRLIDIAVSSLLLFLLAPVFVTVSLAIFLYDRGPVFYRQRRVGRDNREFTIWKFRSMVPGADKLNARYADANTANGLLFKLPDDPRVTPVGNLIRRLSIDELPQLINVLVGDMSLVGPRPLPVDPEDFDADAARRHAVRPGITGPWQVGGGHVLSYDDMIKLDLAYVDSWSVRRDLWYLAMTIPTVLVRRAAY